MILENFLKVYILKNNSNSQNIPPLNPNFIPNEVNGETSSIKYTNTERNAYMQHNHIVLKS